ncbi:MAG TPA: hypothetical protein ENN40_04220 [Candidatus Aminicenantes bacterium]|nr:hypothetical protein [Candidatus Aminicenantes bacterium]
MPYKKYPLIRPAGTRLESIHDRVPRIDRSNFAQCVYPGCSVAEFFSALPRTGAAVDLGALAGRLRAARNQDLAVIMGMDDAAAESALQPLIIDLMERGWISAMAVSWNVAVTDFEIALTGNIGQKIAKGGAFSVAEETGLLLNAGLKEGMQRKIGCGEAIGLYMTEAGFPFSSLSLLYTAYKLNIPVTVHPGGGRNPTRLHPHHDCAVLASLGEKDFLFLASILGRMEGGGIWVQAGHSALLVGILLEAIHFCAANGMPLPQLDAGLLLDSVPCREEENFMHECREAGGWCRRIPGDLSLLLPLLAALLLNPAAEENTREEA